MKKNRNKLSKRQLIIMVVATMPKAKSVLSTSEIRKLGNKLSTETIVNAVIKNIGAKSSGSWVLETDKGNIPATLLQQNQLAGRVLGVPANLVTAAQRSAVYQALRVAIADGDTISVQLLSRKRWENADSIEGIITYDRVSGNEVRTAWTGEHVMNVADAIVTGKVMRNYRDFLDSESHAIEYKELKKIADGAKVTRIEPKGNGAKNEEPSGENTQLETSESTSSEAGGGAGKEEGDGAPI